MPHKLFAVLAIFGTIALMVAWVPCADCTTRFCQYLYELFGGRPTAGGGADAGQQAGSEAGGARVVSPRRAA